MPGICRCGVPCVICCHFFPTACSIYGHIRVSCWLTIPYHRTRRRFETPRPRYASSRRLGRPLAFFVSSSFGSVGCSSALSQSAGRKRITETAKITHSQGTYSLFSCTDRRGLNTGFYCTQKRMDLTPEIYLRRTALFAREHATNSGPLLENSHSKVPTLFHLELSHGRGEGVTLHLETRG